MDITVLFKACVKTVRTRNKALGLADGDKNHILTSNKKIHKSEFAIKAKEIVTSITKMQNFLLQHRKDYVNVNYVMYEASTMSDMVRDQIDRDAQKFMQTCKEVINNLKSDVKKVNTQVVEHQLAIVDMLEIYLKAVCSLFTEQQAIRFKRAFDKQKLMRLESVFQGLKVSHHKEKEEAENEKNLKTSENTSVISTEPEKHLGSRVEDLSTTDSATTENINFSPEELQMFEQENQRLYDEMNTMVDEVREIEGKMVEISQLQEIFADKVLQQEQDANKISDIAVNTTENIKEANEELREAMRKNAGFRLWILFILIVLSFTILFLNWYNP